MDNQFLGSSPTQGQQYYLGPVDANSGSHPAAVLAEVAQTTSNNDVIGPAEFKNFMYETTPGAWQLVPVGKVHIGYGATSSMNLPNPYSASEAFGKQNDFLTGSGISYPTDQCGNGVANGSTLWSTICVGNNWNLPPLSFVDMDGNSLTPTWVSLSDSTSGREIFLTTYNNQQITSPSGQWATNQISWRATNVAAGAIVNSTAPSQTVPTNVFSAKMQVVGYFYSLPVKDTTVIMYLPDSTNETLKTDNNGQAVFTQLPAANYTFHITVPYGISSTATQSIFNPGSIIAKVFSLPELMFEAASRAYEDAGIDPRKDVQSFVCCTEDFWEGISITDEYMPDQLGAVLRPLCTISSDGIIGLATACMHIMSSVADVAVVEYHSKIFYVVNPDEHAQLRY